MSFESTLHVIDPVAVTRDLMPWLQGEGDFPQDLHAVMGDYASELENFLAEAFMDGDPGNVALCLCQLAITHAACRLPWSWGNEASLAALLSCLDEEDQIRIARWLRHPTLLFAGLEPVMPGLASELKRCIDGSGGIGPYVAPEDVPDLLAWLEDWIRQAPPELSDSFQPLLPPLRNAARQGFAYWEAADLTLPDPLPFADEDLEGPDHLQTAGFVRLEDDDGQIGDVALAPDPAGDRVAAEPRKAAPEESGIHLRSWRYPDGVALKAVAAYGNSILLSDNAEMSVVLNLESWPPEVLVLDIGAARAAAPGPGGRWLISAGVRGESGSGLFLFEPGSHRPFRLPVSPPQRQGSRLRRLFRGGNSDRPWNGGHSPAWDSLGFIGNQPVAVSDYASWQMRHIDWPMSWNGAAMTLGGRGLSARQDHDVQPGLFSMVSADQARDPDAMIDFGLVWNGHVYVWGGRNFQSFGQLCDEAWGAAADHIYYDSESGVLYHLNQAGVHGLRQGEKAALLCPGFWRAVRPGPGKTLLLTSSRKEGDLAGCLFDPETGKTTSLSASLFNADRAGEAGDLFWIESRGAVIGLHEKGMVSLSIAGLRDRISNASLQAHLEA